LRLHHRRTAPLTFLPPAPPPPQIHTLSLHDALPISRAKKFSASTQGPPGFAMADLYRACTSPPAQKAFSPLPRMTTATRPSSSRSEEHTSELQSRENLVCRLLLEKKKKDAYDLLRRK